MNTLNNLLIETAALLTALFDRGDKFLTNHTIGCGTFVCWVTHDVRRKGYLFPKPWRDLRFSGSITINSLSDAGQVRWTEPDGEQRSAPWMTMAFIAEKGVVTVLGRYTTPGHRFSRKRLEQFAAWVAAAKNSPLDRTSV